MNIQRKRTVTIATTLLGVWTLAAGVSAQETVTAASDSKNALSQPAAASGLVKVVSHIASVTVYSDRALVTRRATLNLSAGESLLRFDRLPAALDSESVQVKGKGVGVIRGVNLENMPGAGPQDKDLAALVNKQRQLGEDLQAVQDTAAEAKKERDFVDAIARRLTTSSEKSEPGELNPQKWIDMVAFYRKRLAALNQEVRRENPRLIAVQEEMQKVNEQIQNLNRDTQAGKYRAEVVVNLPESGELTLDLTYLVSGPRWSPHYDLRADSKNGKLQAIYQAMITQSTGEDWNNVELTLSTAQPRSGSQHPELQPWRIDTYHEPVPVAPAPAYRQRKNMMPSAARSMAAAPMAAKEVESEDMPAMAVAETVVENQSSAVVFTAGGRQTVDGNNQPHRITVAVLDFPAVFRYSAVPKLVANAFLQAMIKNNSNYPLLAGPTSIFLDNTFVTNGTLKTIAPGEEFEAFLGVDEGIKVEHKLIQRKEQKEGVFGGNVKWLYEYRIKLTNHKSQTRDVVIKDQLPIPGNNDIQVELIEPVIKDGDAKLTKDDLNLLEWHLRLEPGQVLSIPLKFSVSYPKEMRVQGL